MSEENRSTERSTEEKPSLKSAGVESVAHIGADVNAEVSAAPEEGHVDVRFRSDGDHGRMSARLFASEEEARALARRLVDAAEEL